MNNYNVKEYNYTFLFNFLKRGHKGKKRLNENGEKLKEEEIAPVHR
jgi:hypothetical protein